MMPAYGLDALIPFLPGGATTVLAGGHLAGAPPAWVALLVLLGYALILLVPGGRAIARRDIT
jgi:hypothetical protein